MKNLNRKDKPVMPIIPEMMQNIVPVPIPQMKFESNLLSNFFHNWKLKQLDLESARQASIAENKNRQFKAWLDMMREMQTYMVKTEFIFKQVSHAERMMEQDFIEKNLKNQLLHFEVDKAKFEHGQMMKEAENDEALDG